MPKFDVNITNMKLKASKSVRRAYSQTVRADAAEDTGHRILSAFVERLLGQWFDEITLDAVAADAGVTVQTVIRRFGGKEGLLGEAVVVLNEQIGARRGRPSGDVVELVDRLYSDYERVGDAVIRLLSLEARHPAVEKLTAFGRREHRQWVTDAMAILLGKLDASAGEGVIDALVIATDVYTWKLLRRDMGRSISAAKETTRVLVQAIIEEVGN